MPRRDRTVNYLEMQVTDVAAAKAFYGGVFGCRFTDCGPHPKLRRPWEGEWIIKALTFSCYHGSRPF